MATARDSLDKHKESLDWVLDRLNTWVEDGTFQSLEEFARLLGAVRQGATPQMAERMGTLMTSAGGLVEQASRPEFQSLLATTLANEPSLEEIVTRLAIWQEDGTWNALVESAGFVKAVRDSMTPPMIERVGQLTADLGSLLADMTQKDTLTDLKALMSHHGALLESVQQLAQWQEDGSWKSLTELMGLLHAVTNSLTPSMMERMARFIGDAGQALSLALESGLLDLGVNLISEASQSLQDAKKDPRKVTITSLLRTLKEPEMQLGLKTALGILKRLPKVLE